MWLSLWLTLATLSVGVLPQYAYEEGFEIDAVHRVRQDTDHGVQKIQIAADNRERVTVLPLSINSRYVSENENFEPVEVRQAQGRVRDTLSKRQTTPTKAPKRQQTADSSREDSRKPTPTNQKPATSGTHARPESIQNKPSPQQKQPEKPKDNSKLEPKSNQYGIGNTLVLVVQGNESGQPSYVDQNQPHKVTEPARHDSKRTETNRGGISGEVAKPQLDAPRPEPLAKDDNRNPFPVSQKESKQPIPVRQELFEQPNQNNQFYRDDTVLQPKPFIEQYKERESAETRPVTYKERGSSGNRPENYDSNQRSPENHPDTYGDSSGSRRETIDSVRGSTSNRNPETYDTRPAVETFEKPPRRQGEKVSDNKFEVVTNRNPTYQDRYVPEYVIPRPVQPKPSRPNFENVNRPLVEDPASYIELRPTQNQQPNKEEEDSEYTGFPESHQSTRNPGISRPLQYDPPRVFPPSPCHAVFQYEGREPGNDFWNGDLYISTDEVLIGIRLDVVLDRPARLLANWLAEARTKDNIQYTILSLNKRLVPGPAENVKITVKFHADGPVPYLQGIILNGRKICPVYKPQAPSISNQKPTTTVRPLFENPGDFIAKTTTEFYKPAYEEPRTTTRRTQERVTSTENYRESSRPGFEPDANPNYYQGNGNGQNRVPSSRPYKTTPATPYYTPEVIPCGKPAVQARPLVTNGSPTGRGQWPWHAAIYKNVGVDLSYICGGSLISSKHIVTAAHCVTSDFKSLDPSSLVVYLGKYHLRLWSEGGVQNKQVTDILVHENYNKTAFRADLAVLVLSSPVEFTEFIRPVCLWDRTKTDISTVENQVGVVVGWGFDETKQLTEELMQAHMPIVQHNECLWSYPEFFPKFTSNLTYCAGFRNGTSVCNGDSGGGMVFPMGEGKEERWYLRGLVSISVAEKDNRVCDTRHFVVFTDLAQFLPWLEKFVYTYSN